VCRLSDVKCEYCDRKAVVVEVVGMKDIFSSPSWRRVDVYFVCEQHTDSPMNDVK
jgi:hypothetical protein